MKKVTSLLVAVMMLLSIFSVTVFAADANVNDAVMAVRLIPTASSYAPGEEVTFEVEYETTSDLGGVSACTLLVGFDSNTFELLEDASKSPALDNSKTVIFDGYALAGTISLGNSFIQTNTALSDADKAKGWDTVLKIAMCQDGDFIDASTAVKAFAIKLKVKDTAASGTYAIGVTQESLSDFSTFVNEELGPIAGASGTELGFSATKVFDLVDASVVVEGGTTPPPVVEDPTVAVKNLDTKVQWKAAGSNDLLIGFEGELSGFTKDQAETVIASISELGFEFSSTDDSLATSIKATTNVVYDFTADDAGVYKFRAVVRKAMSEADAAGTITHNLYARAYVTIGDKAPVKASDIISTTIHDEYTEGVNNKMLTLAENLAAK